jgi:hypothetical protein
MTHKDDTFPLRVTHSYHVRSPALVAEGIASSMVKSWRKSLNGEREKGRADRAAAVVETSKSL